MQQFQIGEKVLVLPQFVHLYPRSTAVVLEVKLDPFRAMFNEYKIQFVDGSIETVFEFQIREAAD